MDMGLGILGMSLGGQGSGTGGTPAGPTLLTAGLSQSNVPGGEVNGALVSPDDDPVAGVFQISPNGGGNYPAQDPTYALVQDASRGHMRYPSGSYLTTTNVSFLHNFLKKVRGANPNNPVGGLPGGVGGTDMSEYDPAGSIPSGWPKNRWNVIKDAYLAQMAIDPTTTWYAFTASLLENEIANNRGAANGATQVGNYVSGFRSIGGSGSAMCPFLVWPPGPEWIVNVMSKWDYLINMHKAAVVLPNFGVFRRKRGGCITTDIIHSRNDYQRQVGDQTYDVLLPTTISFQTTAPAAPVISLPTDSDMVQITSNGAPYYEMFVEAPPGSAEQKFEMCPFESNMPGEVLEMPIPLKGDRTIRVVAKSLAGDSPSSSKLTFAVPVATATPNTHIVFTDADGSNNLNTAQSIGSDTTAWVIRKGATTGAAALVKRVLIGSEYGIILDNTTIDIFRDAYAFPSGNYTLIAPFLITSNMLNGTIVIGAGASLDIRWGGANSGVNIRADHVTNTVQKLTTSNLFANYTNFWAFLALLYDRTSNTMTLMMNDKVLAFPGTLTQRAASPPTTGGVKLYSGFSGATQALPFRMYNSVLSTAQLGKIKDEYKQAHNINFGVLPAKAA